MIQTLELLPILDLQIAAIRRDGGTQPRAALDPATIADYAEAMRAGSTFPPVVVVFDGTDYWLADGYHRVAAAESLGESNVSVNVYQGDQRAAILYSTSVNAEHGLRRTTADKRRAVEVLLRDPEWRQWSDSEIARQAKVSRDLVQALRLSCGNPQDSAPAMRTVTRAGSTYTMNTANVGANPPAYATADALAGPVRAVVMRLAGNERNAAIRLLAQINLLSPAGNSTLATICTDASLPQPCRPADVRVVCRSLLAELQAAARPAARVGVFSFPPPPETAPTVAATGSGLRSEAEVAAAAEALLPQVWRQLGLPAPAHCDRDRLESARHLTGSLLDLEGFSARRGRNFDWEAFVSAFDADVDHTALRRTIAAVRDQIAALLADPPGAPAVPDTINGWLAALADENDIPTTRTGAPDPEAVKTLLTDILRRRENGGAAAWRSLRAYPGWPPETSTADKLAAVRLALAALATPSGPGAPSARLSVPPPYRVTAVQGDILGDLLLANYQATAWLKSYQETLAAPDLELAAVIGNLEAAAAAAHKDR